MLLPNYTALTNVINIFNHGQTINKILFIHNSQTSEIKMPISIMPKLNVITYKCFQSMLISRGENVRKNHVF